MECSPTQKVEDTESDCEPTQLYDEDDEASGDDYQPLRGRLPSLGKSCCFVDDENDDLDGAVEQSIISIEEEEEQQCVIPGVDKGTSHLDDETEGDARAAEYWLESNSKFRQGTEPFLADQEQECDQPESRANNSLTQEDESDQRTAAERKTDFMDAEGENGKAAMARDQLCQDEEEEAAQREEEDEISAMVQEYRLTKAKKQEEIDEPNEDELKRAAVLEVLEAERVAALEKAESRRSELAQRLKERILREEEENELAAKKKLKELAVDSDEDDDDDDSSLEIIGAPTKTVASRKELRSRLRRQVARQGMERFAAAASIERLGPDEYFRRLEALEAQRFLELRGNQKRIQEEHDLIEAVREKLREPIDKDMDDEVEVSFDAPPQVDEPKIDMRDDTQPGSSTDEVYVAQPGASAVTEMTKATRTNELEQSERPELSRSGTIQPTLTTSEPTVTTNKTLLTPADEPPETESEVLESEPAQDSGDRNAVYRAMLMKEAARARSVPTEGIEVEAEESEDENEGQRGLGDFGFGVTARNTSNDEVEAVELPTKEDLDAIVDELAPHERGDESGADALRKQQDARRDKEEMAAMLRNVREGFETRGRGAARGALSLRELVGFDAAANLEAKRLGLADEDDENADDAAAAIEDDDDEAGLAELISRELKARHLGARRDNAVYEISSDSDDESHTERPPRAAADSDDSEAEEERMALRAKHWAKRAKMRRVLIEAKHRETQLRDEEDVEDRRENAVKQMLDADQDSHQIRSMLSRQSSMTDSQPNSQHSLGSGISQAARDALLTRCGSFFSTLRRSSSLLAQPGGEVKDARKATTTSQSSAGRHVASRKYALFCDTNSNSQSVANSDSNAGCALMAKPRDKRSLSAASENVPPKKRTQYDATASIWANVAKNRFGSFACSFD